MFCNGHGFNFNNANNRIYFGFWLFFGSCFRYSKEFCIGGIMEKLKVKIEFNCLASKKEVEEQLNKIINYQIYEKIWNVDSNKGVKLTIIKEKGA